MAFLFYVKVAFLEESFFFNFLPKFLSVNQIDYFLKEKDLQNGLIVWFHLVHGDLASGFERTG